MNLAKRVTQSLSRRWLEARLAAVRNLPRGSRRCALCDHEQRWFIEGRCAHCRSLPRHRLIAYAIESLPAASTRTIVHIGPVAIERNWIESRLRPAMYHRVDIAAGPETTLVADATALPLPDASADLAIAWHVLEHIPRDTTALAELYRVLAPGGHLVVSVPIYPQGNAKTFEDPATPPADRARIYGYYEHVRACGHDYGERLEAVGFDVTTLAMRDRPVTDVERLGLSPNHVAWIGRRRS